STWNMRTDRYSDERTEQTAKTRKKIEMSYIGG
ncbi:GTP 3',8-cyclase MoaA, partial [Parageobacillus toebii]|nr:GTP 3',8-cyclase MoaA [Parageobacillus toebii]